MKKLWIENRRDSFVVHMAEPNLTQEDDWWHSREPRWISERVAVTILGRENLPAPGQVAEVECEFKTYWEAQETRVS